MRNVVSAATNDYYDGYLSLRHELCVKWTLVDRYARTSMTLIECQKFTRHTWTAKGYSDNFWRVMVCVIQHNITRRLRNVVEFFSF